MSKTTISSGFYRGPVSDHFDGERFFNPWAKMGAKRWRDFFRWRLLHERSLWPQLVGNDERPGFGDVLHRPVRATYIGHATILLQIQGQTMLTDPVFSDRASPFTKMGPRRVRKPFLPLESLPKIDVVFISHNHYDHMDMASISYLARHHQPIFITPLGNSRLIRAIAGDCPIIELDWHQTHTFESGLSVTVTPSQHWSRRSLHDINRDLWGGAIFKDAEGQSIYFTGDSGFHQSLFEELHGRYGSPSLALIPIGAYEPRWFMQYAHMDPSEAMQVHQILKPQKSMGFHFETFQLTNEAFDAPRKTATEAMKQQKIEDGSFLVPYPGDFIEI